MEWCIVRAMDESPILKRVGPREKDFQLHQPLTDRESVQSLDMHCRDARGAIRRSL